MPGASPARWKHILGCLTNPGLDALAQMLVASFTPPAAPPIPMADLGPWVPSEQESAVQSCVLQALTKVTGNSPTKLTPVLPLCHSLDQWCLCWVCVPLHDSTGFGPELNIATGQGWEASNQDESMHESIAVRVTHQDASPQKLLHTSCSYVVSLVTLRISSQAHQKA